MKLSELFAVQGSTLCESVDHDFGFEILEEAYSSVENSAIEEIKKTANSIKTFIPKQYALEIRDIFNDNIKDEKKLQDELLKYFIKSVISDAKRNRSSLIASPNNPRALQLVIEEPERSLIMKELFTRLAKELKAKGIIFTINIDPKNILKDYIKDPHNKTKYTFELLLNTTEEIAAARQKAKQEKQVAAATAANPKSDSQQNSTSEEENFAAVEEIFKRTMKFKHPDFHKVKKRDKVLEEYFDKVVTTMHILGNFVHAGPAVMSNIEETYKGQDITTLTKDIKDIQNLIKEFEQNLGKLVEPSAKEYVKSR
jgi:hypothetical protein